MPLKDREALRQYMRAWDQRKLSDPEYRKKYNERKARERRLRRRADPPKAHILDRRDWLRKAYQVTPEWYDGKLKEQNGVCAICQKAETSKRWSNGRMHVDHNHKTGDVRGLLCSFCNHRLYLIEYPEIFMDAARAYLKQYS